VDARSSLTSERPPRVSVCVPNLNTRPFLPERFRTIFEQTFQDLEVLVYDGFSDDGAWEYICEIAAAEPRMRAWQGPREGTPGSWNACVCQARGEYVYIATSDDTMPPDCLHALVAALDRQPDCDLAHCPLRTFDEHGREIPETAEWWALGSAFARSSGPLLHRPHVRRAPFDGLLHLEGGSVYVSITQLLIRRTLFDRIGLFESTWGSVGDFHWSMRAGLAANTVHVPDTWGGWRVHGRQATAGVTVGSAEHAAKIGAMIDHAIETCGGLLPAPLARRIVTWAAEAKELRAFARELACREEHSVLRRRAFLMRQALGGARPARRYLKARLFGPSFPEWVQERLDQSGYAPTLVAVPPDRSNSGGCVANF
jgi:hypothetical protein